MIAKTTLSALLFINVALAGASKSVYNADGSKPDPNARPIPDGSKPPPNALPDPSVASDSDISPFIVGGTDTTFEEHPYFVWMGFCGGSLVWEDIVLTAAHCNSVPITTVQVGPSQTLVSVEEEIPHPDYADLADGLYYDFKILKIANTVDGAVPLTLEDSDNNPEENEELVIIGLGATEEGGPATDVLQEATVTYFPNDQCQDMYNGIFVITDDHLCAGDLFDGEPNVCQGDSGGPIMDGDRVVGVTSFGVGCAVPFRPAVFARVSHVYDWIYAHICCLSDNPPSNCGDFDLSVCPSPTTSAPTPSPITCDSGTTLFRLVLLTDQYGSETSWEITNDCTAEVVASRDTFFYENSLQYVEQACLADGVGYTFTLSDSAGDGICCQYGAGEYTLTYGDDFMREGGEFDSSESTSFGGSCPTPAPITCDSGTTLFKLDLLTDNYGDETSWNITNDCSGELVASRDRGYYENGLQYVEQVCLADGAGYTFTLYDSAGDGICCGFGIGEYTLTYGEDILTQGGDFGSIESTTFGSCAGVSPSPTPMPTTAAPGGIADCASCDEGKCSNPERCLFMVCDRETDDSMWKCYERHEESASGDACTLNTLYTWSCQSCNYKGNGESCCSGCTRDAPRTDCQACDQQLCAGNGYYGWCLYQNCQWISDGLHQCTGHSVVGAGQTCEIETGIYQCSSCNNKGNDFSCCDGCTKISAFDRTPFDQFDQP